MQTGMLSLKHTVLQWFVEHIPFLHIPRYMNNLDGIIFDEVFQLMVPSIAKFSAFGALDLLYQGTYSFIVGFMSEEGRYS